MLHNLSQFLKLFPYSLAHHLLLSREPIGEYGGYPIHRLKWWWFTTQFAAAFVDRFAVPQSIIDKWPASRPPLRLFRHEWFHCDEQERYIEQHTFGAQRWLLIYIRDFIVNFFGGATRFGISTRFDPRASYESIPSEVRAVEYTNGPITPGIPYTWKGQRHTT